MPAVAVPAWTVREVAPRAATSGAPPLLVLLHGIGADEHDLLPLAAEVDPRFHVVSVRAPQPYGPGFAWFDIQWLPDGRVQPDVAQAHAALADLIAWIGAAPTRFGTDPRRTYLLGFSQGAMLSVGVLRAAPARLAGVAALSGRSPDGLFEQTADEADVARVPLLVAHGTWDDVLPVANGRRLRELFAPVLRDFAYREFPVAHGIVPEEMAWVATWLAAHLDAPAP